MEIIRIFRRLKVLKLLGLIMIQHIRDQQVLEVIEIDLGLIDHHYE